MLSQLIVGLFAAAFGGALGAAAVGLGEAAFVTATSAGGKEHWLFLFAVVSYAAVGALIGTGVGAAWQVVRWGHAKPRALALLAAATGACVPLFAVGRYHVVQRVFREDLVLGSTAGIVTHLVLLAAAVGASAVVVWLLARLYRAAGTLGFAALLLALASVSWAVGRFTQKVEESVLRHGRGGTGRPNVIFIVVDTLRADAIEPFGSASGPTPAFARLARDGVAFTRAYAQSSWTRPSIATMLTGQYPSAHGAVQKMDFLSDRAVTVAETLRGAGYWTAAFVNNINVAPVFNFQQGFDEYVYLEPSFYFGATESATKLAIYKGLRVFRERAFAHRIYFPNYYQDAEVVNGRVMAWLDEHPPEPFFLLVHYMEPHDPYFEIPYNGRGVARVLTPDPPAERAPELRDLYAQQVRYLDRHFEVLMEHLRRSGHYDRSIIAVTADHGEEFQEHGGWWHGTTLYEEAVHVPLIIKPAGMRENGGRRDDPVRTLDIPTTLLAAAGIAVPPSYMGKDVLAGPVQEAIYAEEDLEGNQLAMILSGSWKLITANPGNPRGLEEVELYDLEADREESRNLAGLQAAKVAELMSELHRIRADLSKGTPRLGLRNEYDPDRRS